MDLFELIPNKRPAEKEPELGRGFELNQFYRRFYGAEDWIGEGYLAVWTKPEVLKFKASNLETYPEKHHSFASDGSGA